MDVHPLPLFFLLGLLSDATSGLSCGIILAMDVDNVPGRRGHRSVEQAIPGRLIGLQGRLARPFWGVMGIWAVLCGVFASNRFRWDGNDLLILALILLLTDLAWGSLWDLAVGTDWFHLLRRRPSPSPLVRPIALPYTQPGSPGGRLFLAMSRLAGWWRTVFWPAAGPAVLGFAAAAILALVLNLILPERIHPLNLAFAIILLSGITLGWRGRGLLAGQALVLVALSWLAGNVAFGDLSRTSAVLALCFAVAAWGALLFGDGRKVGPWLQDGAQFIVLVLLVLMQQPLAAGFLGLLLFAQIALQISFRAGADPDRLMKPTWLWLMGAMMIAAVSIP